MTSIHKSYIMGIINPVNIETGTNSIIFYFNYNRVYINEYRWLFRVYHRSTTEVLGLYRLSYMWYSATGFATVFVIGATVSLLSGGNELGDLDPRTMSPPVLWLRRWIPALRRIGVNLVSILCSFPAN